VSSKSRIFARPQQAYVFFLYIDMVFLSKKWCQFHGDFFWTNGMVMLAIPSIEADFLPQKFGGLPHRNSNTNG
jgi:hypothetical protein